MRFIESLSAIYSEGDVTGQRRTEDYLHTM